MDGHSAEPAVPNQKRVRKTTGDHANVLKLPRSVPRPTGRVQEVAGPVEKDDPVVPPIRNDDSVAINL